MAIVVWIVADGAAHWRWRPFTPNLRPFAQRAPRDLGVACFFSRMDLAITRSSFFSDDERRPAAKALALALAAGVFTQSLFWRSGFGLNVWLWDLLIVGGNILVFRRGKIAPAAWGAIAAAVLLGFAMVRYASDWAVVVSFVPMLAILSVLPILLRDRLTLNELASVPWKLLTTIVHVPRAARMTASLPERAVSGRGGPVLRGLFRGLLIGIPTAGFFTLLLSTDDAFATLVGHLKDQIGEGSFFVLMSLVTSTGYLFTHALHSATLHAQAAADTMAFSVPPYRAPSDETSLSAPSPPAPRVSTITWSVVLGQVALVFAIFVCANLRHLFGGRALVRSQSSLTYASYLHAGFSQLLFASILSVCLVVVGHTLLRPRRSGGNRGRESIGAVPGGTFLITIEAALLVLTGVTIASCWQRLQIYEDAYGASELRLGVALIELGILGVLVLTLIKVVARNWRGHGGAVLALGALLCVLASTLNADAYVATANLDRALRGQPLDDDYITRMSFDARVVLDHPYLQAHSDLRDRARSHYCAPRPRDFRVFRGIGSCAAWQ